MKPLIGILGGMGPRSTGAFVNQVVSAFQEEGAEHDDDFPPMVISTRDTRESKIYQAIPHTH